MSQNAIQEGNIMIKGHELRDNETPTLNMVIQVLAYTGHKWIVDRDPIKVQPK